MLPFSVSCVVCRVSRFLCCHVASLFPEYARGLTTSQIHLTCSLIYLTHALGPIEDYWWALEFTICRKTRRPRTGIIYKYNTAEFIFRIRFVSLEFSDDRISFRRDQQIGHERKVTEDSFLSYLIVFSYDWMVFSSSGSKNNYNSCISGICDSGLFLLIYLFYGSSRAVSWYRYLQNMHVRGTYVGVNAGAQERGT
jgi:hypothetical protein